MDYWGGFPESRPRPAKGGIRARSQRGAFGRNWWAERWIAVLESFELGARLRRGRSYARGGQVLSIHVGAGEVSARVQGSRRVPYEVRVGVREISAEDWRKVADRASSQAIFGAELLRGEMPRRIEELFAAAGLSLFPRRASDLKTDCSCPDWSNPCKHIAAVYYLLGEEFDRDPFLIFALRGMEREAFLGLLSEATPVEVPTSASAPEVSEPSAAEPLPADPERFWRGGEIPGDLFGEISEKPVGATLPRTLGGFPFWRGGEDFLDFLDAVYLAAARRTERLLTE